MTKLEANRTNAQLSTGPRTECGKLRSSRNALSHGLQSDEVVLPHEDQSRFERVLAHYRLQVNVSDPEEEHLAEQIAHAQWRLNRAQRLVRLFHHIEIHGPSADPSPDEMIVRNMQERGADVGVILHRHEVHFQRLWWRIRRELQAFREAEMKTATLEYEEMIARQKRYLEAQNQPKPPAAPDEAPEPAKTPVPTVEEIAAKLDTQGCLAVIDAIENSETAQTNPTPFQTWLNKCSDSDREALYEAAKTKIAQTKPKAMAA